jgi:hypothetical protein
LPENSCAFSEKKIFFVEDFFIPLPQNRKFLINIALFLIFCKKKFLEKFFMKKIGLKNFPAFCAKD